MKLSIVILCWNDLKVIRNCLESIYAETRQWDFEVLVSDNGSTDGSLESIRTEFPRVRLLENGKNLGFAGGNNAGIRVAQGDYILILNPDTIVLARALDKLVAYAEEHAEAGAFGCRVLNPDGSFQNPARPLPTLRGSLIAALRQRWLGYLSDALLADQYVGWQGETERAIGYQSGCCILIRGELLKRLGGFDERFFYHYEETDLCQRVWQSGSSIRFCPTATITHLGGRSAGSFRIRLALESCRSRYRYFFKHFGIPGALRAHRLCLLHVGIRWLGCWVKHLLRPDEAVAIRLQICGVVLRWNWNLDPLRFLHTGEEPDLGYAPLAPAPRMVEAC